MPCLEVGSSVEKTAKAHGIDDYDVGVVAKSIFKSIESRIDAVGIILESGRDTVFLALS